jgi:hypothetical protein
MWRRREAEGGGRSKTLLPDPENPRRDRFDLLRGLVHQKRKRRARSPRAATTMPRLIARMMTAKSGVRSDIDRLGMVKISSGDSLSIAPYTAVAIRKRPARESGPSRGLAAPRRPCLAVWGIPGRPLPSQTLRLRFLSPQKCPDKLQSKSSCGDPISLLWY